MTAEKRYPLADLVRASGMSEHALGQKVGLAGTPLIRARELGLVESAADRYACRAGLVPWLVWSDWLANLEVGCADVKCDETFVPSRKGNRFCSRRCSNRARDRAHKRRRYQTDAAYREAKLAAAREYRVQADRAVKMAQRAYRAANAERIAASHQAWCVKNRERVAERRRAYYLENRDVLLAKQREIDRRRRGKAAA